MDPGFSRPPVEPHFRPRPPKRPNIDPGFGGHGGGPALLEFLRSHGTQPARKPQGVIEPQPGPMGQPPTRDTDPFLDGQPGMEPQPAGGVAATMPPPHGMGGVQGVEDDPSLGDQYLQAGAGWGTNDMGAAGAHAGQGADVIARLFALLHQGHRPGAHGPMSHPPSRSIAR